jgi:hypothetical protein
MADYLAKSPAWSATLHTAYDAVQPGGFKVEWNGMRKITLIGGSTVTLREATGGICIRLGRNGRKL